MIATRQRSVQERQTGFIEITSHVLKSCSLFLSLSLYVRSAYRHDDRALLLPRTNWQTRISPGLNTPIRGEATETSMDGYHTYVSTCHVPGCGAIPVKNVEVLAAEQLAPIDAGLDGSETA